MKVGIKFCGGCNPRYDRRKELTKLQQGMTGVEWVTDNRVICDYWLVACGCARECVDISRLIASKEVLVLTNTMDYRNAKEILDKGRQEESGKKEKKTIQIGQTETLSLLGELQYIILIDKQG